MSKHVKRGARKMNLDSMADIHSGSPESYSNLTADYRTRNLSQGQIYAMYQSNHIANLVVSKPAYDMTRNGWEFTSENEELDKVVNDKLKQLNSQTVFYEFLRDRWLWGFFNIKIERYESMPNIHQNLVGKRFGRLTVLRDSGRRGKNNAVVWECLCACGKHSFVTTGSLNSGQTKSCGHPSLKALRDAVAKHVAETPGTNYALLNDKKPVTNTSGEKTSRLCGVTDGNGIV